MIRDVTETEEGWTAPVFGFAVSNVSFGGQIYLTAYADRADDEREAPSTTISFAGAFLLQDRSGTECQLNAEDPWETMVGLFTLRHDRIASAIADRRGWLVVRFDSGARLEVGPDGHYENWQLSGPNGILIVGMPSGGEPAVWNAVREEPRDE